MHQRKYFTSNFFNNEIFSVKKFPNYSKLQSDKQKANNIDYNTYLLNPLRTRAGR